MHAGLEECAVSLEKSEQLSPLIGKLFERKEQLKKMILEKKEGLMRRQQFMMRNLLEADLGLKLPTTLVWNHPTVAALVPHLAQRMGIPLEAAAAASTAPEEGIAHVLDEIERLSAEETRRLLQGTAPK